MTRESSGTTGGRCFFSENIGVFAVAVAFRAGDEASITCTRSMLVYSTCKGRAGVKREWWEK